MATPLASSARRHHPRDASDKFPTAQLFLLSLARISEPIALTSIFPYAWSLVRSYRIGQPADAAFYAGILIAAFSLAEAVSGVLWGSVSDRIGRKPVLLIGTAGTLLSLLIVGCADGYAVALAGRVVGGLLNGNIGVIQTMVGEITTNPKHEPLAYAVMPFVWTIGTIIGPSLSGAFSEPASSWPHLFPPTGLFGRKPYLLPNLICAGLQLLSIFAAWYWLKETHPDMQTWSTRDDLRYTTAETPLLPTTASMSSAPANISHESYGTFEHDIKSCRGRPDPRLELKRMLSTDSIPAASAGRPCGDKAFTKPVVLLVIALGIFTYHSMTYDHLLPIFLQDVRATTQHSTSLASDFFTGGLGLSIRQVGIIMSLNGLIALLVQAVVFPALASSMGIWPLFQAVTSLHPIAYLLIPALLLVPQQLVTPSLYAALLVRNLFSILAYPLLLILIKEATPSPVHLGRINGLAASTGAACRTLASPVSGILFGLGTRWHFSALPWFASALVAGIGALQILWLRRSRHQCRLGYNNKADDEGSESGIARSSAAGYAYSEYEYHDLIAEDEERKPSLPTRKDSIISVSVQEVRA